MSGEDPSLTRARLLDAASRVFASSGFKTATVREICANAGVNVASVNYHFGDKLGLYTEVLKRSADPEAQERIRTAVAGCESPEEQLHVFVRGMFQKLLGVGDSGLNIQLMAQELAHPTPALSTVVDHVIRPQYKQLCDLLGRAIRRPATHPATRLCVHSLIGQITHYIHGRAVISHLWPELKMTQRQVDGIARHIVRFTLAGLEATARSQEKHT